MTRQGHTAATPPFDEWSQSFLVEFAKSGNVTQSASLAGVTRYAVWLARQRDAEFAEAYMHARQEAVDTLYQEARRRALDASDYLLWKLLASMRPEEFSDRSKVEMTGKDGGPIEHVSVVDTASDHEKSLLRDAIRNELARREAETTA
jgi:hypothetical protein